MRKFLQWSLVTLVAIVLLAAVVGQILASSTGRAREVSVAVLKEKLARLEAQRVAVAGEQVSSSAGATLPVIAEETAERVEADTLRARWLALFAKMEEVNDTCGVSDVEWHAVTDGVFEAEVPTLDEELRDALLKYQSCVTPMMDELRALRDLEPNLDTLFEFEFLRKHQDVREGMSRLSWELRRALWIGATLDDPEGVIDIFTSLSYLAIYAPFGGGYFWNVGDSTNWSLLRPVIASATLEEQRWGRLQEILKTARSREYFMNQVHRDTAWIMERFETWKAEGPLLGFSDAPVTYIRTWAYPRLTPALFDHDFDRFNRAMDQLLDLADKPYFEIKDDLAQFCDDFDVEPDIDSIKFTRGNPGWYYVLELSRHEFEQNARNQASIDVIRFAILLEKHKRDNGNYPESLEVFSEALGGSVPVNPLVGDAYVYERTEDSFRLGFRQEREAELMTELDLEDTTVTWWHDPLGYGLEGFDEHPAAEEVTTTESQE